MAKRLFLPFLLLIEAVEEYLRRQDDAEKEGEHFIEEHFDTKSLRERILARRAQLARTA